MQQLSQLSSVLESCEWITFARREASEGTRSERRAWEPTTVWVNREERKEHRWDRRGFVPIQTHTQLLIGHTISYFTQKFLASQTTSERERLPHFFRRKLLYSRKREKEGPGKYKERNERRRPTKEHTKKPRKEDSQLLEQETKGRLLRTQLLSHLTEHLRKLVPCPSILFQGEKTLP